MPTLQLQSKNDKQNDQEKINNCPYSLVEQSTINLQTVCTDTMTIVYNLTKLKNQDEEGFAKQCTTMSPSRQTILDYKRKCIRCEGNDDKHFTH